METSYLKAHPFGNHYPKWMPNHLSENDTPHRTCILIHFFVISSQDSLRHCNDQCCIPYPAVSHPTSLAMEALEALISKADVSWDLYIVIVMYNLPTNSLCSSAHTERHLTPS